MKHAGCLEWSNEESSGGKSPASPGPGEAVGRQASGCSSVLQQPSRSPEQASAAGVVPCATTRTSLADERTREGHAAACRPFPQPASYQADIVPPSRSDNTSGGLPRRQQWPRLKSGASLWLLLLGQLLALLLTSTGILSEVLADAGFRAPMLQVGIKPLTPPPQGLWRLPILGSGAIEERQLDSQEAQVTAKWHTSAPFKMISLK